MSKEEFFSRESRFVVFLLRLFMGILMFYSGITKVLTPNWSASSFLTGQATYGPFKEAFLVFANNGLVDFLVMWGLTLIGLALIVGLFVRLASFFGIVLMILFYLPRLPPAPPSWFVEEHVIFAAVFLLLMYTKSSTFLGLEKAFIKTKFAKRNPWLKKYL